MESGTHTRPQAMHSPIGGDGAACPLVIAVYGSDKKFQQNFLPFVNHCETVAGDGSLRVCTPVYRIRLVPGGQEDSQVGAHATTPACAAAACGPPFSVCMEPEATQSQDAIRVLFMKLSTETADERGALERWVESLQKRQRAAGKRSLVVVDGFHATDAVRSRVSLCRLLGRSSHLAGCGLIVPLTFALHRTGPSTVWEYICGDDADPTTPSHPYVVKTDVSSGPAYTHKMMVMRGVAQQRQCDVQEDRQSACTMLSPDGGACSDAAGCLDCPCSESLVVQQVIKDASVVYKVYVIGGSYAFVKVLRNDQFLAASMALCHPSAGRGDVDVDDPARAPLLRSWLFCSQDKSLFPLARGDSATWEYDLSNPPTGMVDDDDVHAALHKLLADVVPHLQRVLNFGLFGMDLVPLPFEASSVARRGRFAVLDVNYFPSFKGVPDAQEKLLRYVERCVEKYDTCVTLYVTGPLTSVAFFFLFAFLGFSALSWFPFLMILFPPFGTRREHSAKVADLSVSQALRWCVRNGLSGLQWIVLQHQPRRCENVSADIHN